MVNCSFYQSKEVTFIHFLIDNFEVNFVKFTAGKFSGNFTQGTGDVRIKGIQKKINNETHFIVNKMDIK